MYQPLSSIKTLSYYLDLEIIGFFKAPQKYNLFKVPG